MEDEDSIRRLAHEITRYLEERPDAVDTADGILRWWLPPRGVETTPDILRRALDVLADARVIERRELPDGRSVFGRVCTDPDNRHK